MDFGSLLYQFSSIEFYEANTMQREANIKKQGKKNKTKPKTTRQIACFFKSNLTVQLLLCLRFTVVAAAAAVVASRTCFVRRVLFFFIVIFFFLPLFPLVAALRSRETAPCRFQSCKPRFTLHRFSFPLFSTAALLFVAPFFLRCVCVCVRAKINK